MGRDTWEPVRAPLGVVGAVLCGLLLLIVCALAPPPARAATGYEPDAVKSQITLGAQFPHGVAIDQANQLIYVAIFVHTLSFNPNGEVMQLNMSGTPTASSPFTAGSPGLFTGVAVSPVTSNIYAARGYGQLPSGLVGEPRMHQFSAAGAALTSFSLNNPAANAPQIAADSLGRVYYPNPVTQLVEVFDSSGALQSTINCSGCPGGSFSTPVSVAIDPADNVYVADLDRDFAVKLKPASQSFAFERLFQSGRGAGAVAVDPVSGDVFVGDLPGGHDYHVVAYDSSGVQFDDFAAGMVSNPPPEAGRTLTPQLAVNAATRKLYIADQGRLLVFERTTISPPAVTTNAAASVGQLKATLKATVNANGHAVLDCEFEYTDHADFLANAYANATTVPCPNKPNTQSATPVAAEIAGLTPSTTYHYRSDAANDAGSTPGGEQTFTTLPAVPPTVTAQPATGVGQTGATLVGRVNPQGGTVSDCHFEYGTSTSYETEIPCASLPGHVTTDVPQSRNIAGLTAGTTYHYRLVVTSNAGTTKGADVGFTTASPPPPPTTPPPSDSSQGSTPSPPTATPPIGTVPPLATPKRKPLRCKKGFRKKRVRGKLRCVKKPQKRRLARQRNRSS
jgi:hypothetical protein